MQPTGPLRLPEAIDVLNVLRALLHTEPGGDYRRSKQLEQALIDKPNLGGHWRAQHKDKVFNSLLRGRANPPKEIFEDILLQCAEWCCAGMGMLASDAPELLVRLKRPVASLDAAIDAALGFATNMAQSMAPSVDQTMRPSTADEQASGEVDELFAALVDSDTKVHYIEGPPFSSKRRLMRMIVARLSSQHLDTKARRLPAFVHETGAWSGDRLIDRLFDFYAGDDPGARELRETLEPVGKIAYVRAASAKRPAFIVLSDVEPFSENPLVRRLHGDRIGDVLQALAVDSHKDTRLLLGVTVHPSQKAVPLPWRDRARSWPVKPSPREYDAGVAEAGPALQRTLPKGETLQPLTRRLALPVLDRLGTDPTALGEFTTAFVGALEADDPNADNSDAVFRVFWDVICQPTDRILLGLIASSHDGLRMSTLVDTIGVLQKMDHDGDVGAIADVPTDREALKDWQLAQFRFVRWRRYDESENAISGELYIREPSRSIILRHWSKTQGTLWRDGMWCIAREAARQAKELGLRRGADSADAQARNLQALHALLTSIDPEKISPDEKVKPPRPARSFESEVLPPLSVPLKRRPGVRRAYRFAWSQLYRLDIDYGNELINTKGDAEIRVDALIPFLRPDKPWLGEAGRDLTEGSEHASLKSLGLAGDVLEPLDQLDLLTRLSMAALAAGRYRLVADCLSIAREVWRANQARPQARRAPITAEHMMRLIRAEFDLWILLSGDPRRAATLRARGSGPLPDSAHKLDAVVQHIEKEIAALIKNEASATAVAIARGKLSLRLAEVHHLRGERAEEGRALRRAIMDETLLIRGNGDASLAPITAGYGIRRLIRYYLGQQRDPEHRALAFNDGFLWPIVTPQITRTLRRVRRFLDVNERRALRGIKADFAAIQIDRCLIAMAERDLVAARRHLNAAERAGARSSSAHDTLFELAALRVELVVEETMDLAHSMELEATAGDRVRLAAMVQQAQDALETFGRLAPPELSVYGARHRLLAAQLCVLQSRLAYFECGACEAELAAAEAGFDEAAKAFDDIGLGAWRARTEATLAAVREVRSRSPNTHQI